ncbi:MAG: cation transporter [Sulfurimonas sp. RIFCSPHIGHO2_12_FULL_36_9]|uniref:cation diffusion facilitator family transporter n=1 Tax=Sulfurimonas sp. RIFCSPLOWO2_12_36_12 TaxID=1802253 RepID=UPI0008BADA2C|nr:cation diffusion facilitator family transporter [Sulfurimonas sp. RIFCSPLOWO2_12_36_12]OHD96574.1 MAG: cation transporter [Sulfurimonas sp. RIFCSPHIGHO2_12_FULL_36_9]OHD99698.1 MAG: cation transporter [Sulfurimonas sp. RIFCSPLOWO2_02_FULL_36_28]OHE02270.1 MAG: cation transporter [Sulfurimonas sp. RIFCSPLOWO2_12_36_12]OHE07301.1 MAG: cation transporter [Sulfurimonas sp. RIFCSPLOWO2_12_FULL_36_74]
MRLEKKATVVSTSVASLLVIMKMTVGILSGSIAVLASAIDSLLDLTVSLFNYFALHNSEKDPDDKFHHGRSKLEPLAAVVEGTIISLSALFILYEAFGKIAHPREMEFMGASIAVMLASIIITSMLVFFLNSVAKKTKNMVIRADALHYKTDIFSNGAVLLALGLISFTGEDLIDPILGMGIGIYMIYSAFPIIKEGVLMLLDAALSEEDIAKIKNIIESDKITANYHHLQTRESGSHIFISVHIVFNTSISLYDAHLISDKLEVKLKKNFKDKKTHIIIHMDPYDDSNINEMEDIY